VSENRVRNIVIVGGGAAGWLAAGALARLLKPDFCNVRLIENGAPPPGSLSQVALPSFHRLNALLGINENDLMQRTRATFRLGTQFVAWSCIGDSYFHTSGSLGARLGWVRHQPCRLLGGHSRSAARPLRAP
jgi:tryptophan halogenase